MTDPFGLDAPNDAFDDAPEPNPRKVSRARKSAPAVDLAAAAEAAADAKATQDAILARDARELADLAQRVAHAGNVQGPETGDEAPAVSPIEFVIGRWNGYATADKITRLGLPVGARLRAQPLGSTGVEVRVKVPAGTVLPVVGRAVVETARAWEWGEYRAAPVDATSFKLTREIVGDDPATPWRAAGRTAAAVFANEPRGIRQKLWETAGLTVKQGDGSLLHPELIELVVGDRGPEILIDPPAGISTDAAIKVAPVLRRLLRCEALEMVPEGVRVRVELRTKPAVSLPQTVPLWPTALWRPTTPEQAVAVGKRITIPVGLTLRDGRVESISIEPAKVPHGVVVGVPGSGKSRWIRTAATGWAIAGGWLAIGDPKGGELVEAHLPGTVHVSTSQAAIYRLLFWAQTEMKRRLAVQEILKRKHGISPPPFQPIWVLIDEFGQMMTELGGSTDPAKKLARDEVESVVTQTMQVGRSVGIHLTLISQNALAASLPGGICQAASFRVIAGRPQGGAAGSGTVDRLFPAAMKERAAELGATISVGERGALLLDHDGEPVIARSFYGYTPGEEPEAKEFSDLPEEILASWRATREALKSIPPVRRFGWRPGPDTPPDWQGLSLSAGPKGEWPTVKTLEPVWLDEFTPTGVRALPEMAKFDPISDEFEGGFDLLDLGRHLSPKTR